MDTAFRRFSTAASYALGTHWAFISACALLIGWTVYAWFDHFSNSAQLVINTLTTCCSFIMLFVVQNTQNRDTEAVRLQLAEIIVSLSATSNKVIDAASMSDAEIEKLWKVIDERRNGGG